MDDVLVFQDLPHVYPSMLGTTHRQSVDNICQPACARHMLSKCSTHCVPVCICGGTLQCIALGVVWKKNSQWILDCAHKRANKGEEARGSKIVKVTIDTPVLSRLVRIALACQNEAKLLKSRFI